MAGRLVNRRTFALLVFFVSFCLASPWGQLQDSSDDGRNVPNNLKSSNLTISENDTTAGDYEENGEESSTGMSFGKISKRKIAGDGSAEEEKTSNAVTEMAKLVKDESRSAKESDEREAPSGTFALRYEQSDEPCLLTKMVSSAKISYLDVDDEKRTTYINIPSNASVSGSCDEPLRIKISWVEELGFNSSLVFKAAPSRKNVASHERGEISIDQVEFLTFIDDLTFPGTNKTGEILSASAAGQDLFTTNQLSLCNNVTVDMNSSIGPISICFMDIQLKKSSSKFSDEAQDQESKEIDSVAVGIGCFFGAIIITALVSYAFCQWWRKRQ